MLFLDVSLNLAKSKCTDVLCYSFTSELLQCSGLCLHRHGCRILWECWTQGIVWDAKTKHPSKTSWNCTRGLIHFAFSISVYSYFRWNYHDLYDVVYIWQWASHCRNLLSNTYRRVCVCTNSAVLWCGIRAVQALFLLRGACWNNSYTGRGAVGAQQSPFFRSIMFIILSLPLFLVSFSLIFCFGLVQQTKLATCHLSGAQTKNVTARYLSLLSPVSTIRVYGPWTGVHFLTPEFTARVDRCQKMHQSWRAVNSAHELGPWTRVVETGFTRALKL